MTQAATLSLANAASLTLELLSRFPKVHAKSVRKNHTMALELVTESMRELRNDYVHNSLEICQAIQHGFDGRTVELATEVLELSQGDVARIMDSTEKTVRTMKLRKTLDQTASDKVFRLVKAYVAAYILFEDADDAREWLKEPSEALGGAIPLDLLSSSEGEQLVHYEIAQMEYGHPV